MSKPPADPTPPPPRDTHKARLESALLNVETAKDTLQKVAGELPNPPTVEVVLKGQRKRELATATGADPTEDERKLGVAERSIERLDEVAKDLKNTGWSGPMPWLLD